ncbi:MAG: glutamate decarboxylase [Bacillota bacterium]
MGWVVVYIAPNRAVAKVMKELLEKEGLLAAIRPLGGYYTGGKPGQFEVLVPSSEAQDASELLTRSFRP